MLVYFNLKECNTEMSSHHHKYYMSDERITQPGFIDGTRRSGTNRDGVY